MDYLVVPLGENFWSIEQRGVRSFLFAGETNAILVDTGFGGDLPTVCHTLTQQPITLLTTHADIDHIGCDAAFSVHYMHPAEWERYQNSGANMGTLRPIWEGDVFSVGAYTLEAVLIPGHTPGSIALLDRKNGILLSGDSVQDGCIYMHGNGRCLAALKYSLQKLNELRISGAFDTIYASHGTVKLPADIIEDHLEMVGGVLEHKLLPVSQAPERFPQQVKVFAFGRAKMYYDDSAN